MFFDKRNARNFATLINSSAIKEPRESKYRFSVIIPPPKITFNEFKLQAPIVNEQKFNIWLSSVRNENKKLN